MPEDWLPLVYEELRRLAASKMAGEKPGNTLQPTALVHEAWLKLSHEGRANAPLNQALSASNLRFLASFLALDAIEQRSHDAQSKRSEAKRGVMVRPPR